MTDKEGANRRMSVTIVLNDSLADQLRAQAGIEQQMSTEEQAELSILQAELDERLGHWDDQLLTELSGLEQAVESLRDDGK
jgi:hypothetical protein